jgi:hypothetical protein
MKKAFKLELEKVEDVKPMSKMRPLEVCVVVGECGYKGHVVMRTASIDSFEVIDLTELREDYCWEDNAVPINVKPYEGDSITIRLK